MDVETVAVAGEWIRHAPHRSTLLGRAAEPTDGRWQRGETVRALYLADEPATAVAEWYRLLAERGLPPARAIPHDHHFWEIHLELVDLSTPERLARLGLDAPRPGRRTWPPYQAAGEQLFRRGRPASSCSAAGMQGSSRPAPPARTPGSPASSTAVPGRLTIAGRSEPPRSSRLPHPPPA